MGKNMWDWLEDFDDFAKALILPVAIGTAVMLVLDKMKVSEVDNCFNGCGGLFWWLFKKGNGSANMRSRVVLTWM